MKILSIGNSFSQDAHRWLHKLAEHNGIELETVNLFIGGCSLETHWKNVEENNAHYDLEVNGGSVGRKISIDEALSLEEWDVITLQQVSHDSGKYVTFEPYLSSLAEIVRKKQPNAKLYFHQTWAYDIGSSHGSFVIYDNDQALMYRMVKETCEKAAKSIGAGLIPTGDVIQTLRETVPEFDLKNGGLSLCRDTFHLSLDYGRYAAAATWLRTITGNKIKVTEFGDFDTQLLNKIIDVVNKL